MAAAHSNHAGRGLGPAEQPCPDPAAHDEKDRKLQEQASTAALYVTSPDRLTNDRDANNISSASAAASLKHARPADLPSFPIVGIDAANSAGTAALLAAGNKTKIECWKPDGSPDNALRAALLAHDQKMAPPWKPDLSAAGSKAALLAHRDSAKPDKRSHEPSADGNSAAGIAMRSKGLSAQWNYGFPGAGKMNALTAATGAFAAENRKKSEATVSPHPSYPDAANSAQSSLSAATLAHAPSTKKKKEEEDAKRRPESDALQSSRIAHIGSNIPREMYSSSPPVSLEVNEKRRQDALHASAISMANKMYDNQKKHAAGEAVGLSNPGQTAARVSSNRPRSTISSPNSSPDIRTEALQYLNLQEQAQKLASERLSKIDAERPADFRNYYGYGGAPLRKRLSIRRRRRAASDGDIKDSDDEEQAQRVRNQMSLFNKQLAEVDMKKRQKDRESLMAAAEKKVHAQMHSIDEKVFQETGKVSDAMMEEWEAKAKAKAARESEQRMENHGKVHVGGGKFLDQKDIDEIAAERVHPTLLEIGEAAEAQRAKDEEKRLDEAEKKRMERLEKEREAERKAVEKRIRNEEKASEKTRKAEEKALAKTKKEADKALKKEEQRLKKAANRKSKDFSKDQRDVESTGIIEASKPAAESRPTTSGSANERGRNTRPAPVTVPSYRSEVDAIADVSSSEGGDETPGNTIPLPQIVDSDTEARPSTTTEAAAATSSAPQKSPLPPFAPTSPVPPTPKFAPDQVKEPKAPEPTKSHRFKSLLTHLKISRPWTDSASGTAPDRPTTSQGSTAADPPSFARSKLARANRPRPASFIGGAALMGSSSRSASQNRISYSASHSSSSIPSFNPNPGGNSHHHRDGSRKRTSSTGHRAPGLLSAVLGRARPSSSAAGAAAAPANHRHTLHFGASRSPASVAADVSVSSLSSAGDANANTPIMGGGGAAAARGRLPRRTTSTSKVSSLSGEGEDHDFFEEARDRFDVDGDVGSMSNASVTRSGGEADSLSGGAAGNRSRERGASHGSSNAGGGGEGSGSAAASVAEKRRSRIVSGSPVRETRFTERF